MAKLTIKQQRENNETNLEKENSWLPNQGEQNFPKQNGKFDNSRTF